MAFTVVLSLSNYLVCVSLSSRALPAFKRTVKSRSSRSAFRLSAFVLQLRIIAPRFLYSCFVLLSFPEIVDLVSCVDLGVEVGGKSFDGCFFHLGPTLPSRCNWKAGKVGSETAMLSNICQTCLARAFGLELLCPHFGTLIALFALSDLNSFSGHASWVLVARCGVALFK